MEIACSRGIHRPCITLGGAHRPFLTLIGQNHGGSPTVTGSKLELSRIDFRTHRGTTKNLRTSHPTGLTRVLPFDLAWAPNLNAQSIAPQLFAFSLFPYLAFLFFITKSGKFPPLTSFGFYFLLAFVGATIPAGIYAKIEYGTSLANVDWLHGAAESLLTVTNLFIVLGLRQGIREFESKKAAEDVKLSKEKSSLE